MVWMISVYKMILTVISFVSVTSRVVTVSIGDKIFFLKPKMIQAVLFLIVPLLLGNYKMIFNHSDY